MVFLFFSILLHHPRQNLLNLHALFVLDIFYLLFYYLLGINYLNNLKLIFSNNLNFSRSMFHNFILSYLHNFHSNLLLQLHLHDQIFINDSLRILINPQVLVALNNHLENLKMVEFFLDLINLLLHSNQKY